jgi:hypothetical protein
VAQFLLICEIRHTDLNDLSFYPFSFYKAVGHITSIWNAIARHLRPEHLDQSVQKIAAPIFLQEQYA